VTAWDTVKWDEKGVEDRRSDCSNRTGHLNLGVPRSEFSTSKILICPASYKGICYISMPIYLGIAIDELQIIALNWTWDDYDGDFRYSHPFYLERWTEMIMEQGAIKVEFPPFQSTRSHGQEQSSAACAKVRIFQPCWKLDIISLNSRLSRSIRFRFSAPASWILRILEPLIDQQIIRPSASNVQFMTRKWKNQRKRSCIRNYHNHNHKLPGTSENSFKRLTSFVF